MRWAAVSSPGRPDRSPAETDVAWRRARAGLRAGCVHRTTRRPHPEAEKSHAPLLRGVRTRPSLALSDRSSATLSQGDGSTGRALTSGTHGMGGLAEADLRHRRSAMRVLRRPTHGGLHNPRPVGRPGDNRRGPRCGHASRAAASPGIPSRSPRSSGPLTKASRLTPPALATPHRSRRSQGTRLPADPAGATEPRVPD